MHHQRILNYITFFNGKREISQTNKGKPFLLWSVFSFSYTEHPFQDNKNAKIQMVILKWFMC